MTTGLSATVIADSISPAGHRLTTMEVTFHRFVLAEFNTHRSFSRNSASSRAIPTHKLIQRVKDHPALPVRWPAEQKGMQGGDDLPKLRAVTATRHWLQAAESAVEEAEFLMDLGVHKSVINRLLEPFMWHTVICSATDWDGFWEQRCSRLAQPEIAAVAELMREAYDQSTPRGLYTGAWHTPYITEAEQGQFTERERGMISAARCARVSYLTHDGKRDPDADLRLYDRLVTARPPHSSPLEHVATPALPGDRVEGNFLRWHQLRHWSDR